MDEYMNDAADSMAYALMARPRCQGKRYHAVMFVRLQLELGRDVFISSTKNPHGGCHIIPIKNYLTE